MEVSGLISQEGKGTRAKKGPGSLPGKRSQRGAQAGARSQGRQKRGQQGRTQEPGMDAGQPWPLWVPPTGVSASLVLRPQDWPS